MKIKHSGCISFLGIAGSYTHQAAKKLFPDSELYPFSSFRECLRAVDRDDCDATVIPIENSIAGRVADAHRLMLTTNLQIATETLLRIEHCLVSKNENAKLIDGKDYSAIKRVLSHPQALSQCRNFLDLHMPNAKRVSSSDTANAVVEMLEMDSLDVAAIGSRAAASEYNACVLESGIADYGHNVTRFLCFTKDTNLDDDGRNNITTLIFQISHYPGALVEALSVFRDHGINLTKLETYMISESISHPTFYVDVGAGLGDENFHKALGVLKEKALYIKLMGTYETCQERSAQIGFLPTES